MLIEGTGFLRLTQNVSAKTEGEHSSRTHKYFSIKNGLCILHKGEIKNLYLTQSKVQSYYYYLFVVT